jgi:hypothetical protein
MMLTKLADLGLVAGAPAQGDVDDALALDLGGVMCPVVEDRHGLGEGAAALQAPDVGDGRVGARNSANSEMPPSWTEDLLTAPVGAEGVPGRSSRTTRSARGRGRRSVGRGRERFVVELASLRKICGSAQYRTRVPVTPRRLADDPSSGVSYGVNGAWDGSVRPSAGSANTPGSPRRKLIA